MQFGLSRRDLWMSIVAVLVAALVLSGCSSGSKNQTPPAGGAGNTTVGNVLGASGSGSSAVSTGGTSAGSSGSGAVPPSGGSGAGAVVASAGQTAASAGTTAQAGAMAAAGSAAGAGVAGSGNVAPPSTPYLDPGQGPWEMVAPTDVGTVCKLDLSKLQAAEATATYPWLIVRYGKLCYQHNAMSYPPGEAWSTTKTLGALVTGMVSYQTRMIMRTGPKTGQLSDLDRADAWLDAAAITYNKDAKVAHVLGMVAHDLDLSWGAKSFAYDTIGTTEINSLGDMIIAAIAQDPTRLGTSVADFTQKFLYTPLGMKNSSWGGVVFAYSWTVDLMDMARVGVLINHYGSWAGEQLVDPEWIYRQTHPSWEDANTGFGYLTWLNATSNWCSIDGAKQQMANTPGPCAPVAIHKSYPHGASEAKDCNYTPPATCDQKYDVGVWNAEGLGGQLIQGHRGLDLVIVARDAQPGGAGPGTSNQVWDALKSAVIAGDPTYKGDETSFCKDYGSNNYAPDL